MWPGETPQTPRPMIPELPHLQDPGVFPPPGSSNGDSAHPNLLPQDSGILPLNWGINRIHRDQQYVLDVTGAPENGPPPPDFSHAHRLPVQRETYIVVGVQDTRDVLSQVAVQNSLDVATNVDWRTEVGTGSDLGQAWVGVGRGC